MEDVLASPVKAKNLTMPELREKVVYFTRVGADSFKFKNRILLQNIFCVVFIRYVSNWTFARKQVCKRRGGSKHRIICNNWLCLLRCQHDFTFNGSIWSSSNLCGLFYSVNYIFNSWNKTVQGFRILINIFDFYKDFFVYSDGEIK